MVSRSSGSPKSISHLSSSSQMSSTISSESTPRDSNVASGVIRSCSTSRFSTSNSLMIESVSIFSPFEFDSGIPNLSTASCLIALSRKRTPKPFVRHDQTRQRGNIAYEHSNRIILYPCVRIEDRNYFAIEAYNRTTARNLSCKPKITRYSEWHGQQEGGCSARRDRHQGSQH